MSNDYQKILLVDAGIAGLAFASRMNALGVAVEIVEKSSQMPRAGYVVGVYKNGLDVLSHLNLFDKALQRGWKPDFQLLTDSNG